MNSISRFGGMDDQKRSPDDWSGEMESAEREINLNPT
jgi:hypothetical protein